MARLIGSAASAFQNLRVLVSKVRTDPFCLPGIARWATPILTGLSRQVSASAEAAFSVSRLSAFCVVVFETFVLTQEKPEEVSRNSDLTSNPSVLQ